MQKWFSRCSGDLANVVIVALADKMARTIWAALANEGPYQQGHVSVKLA